MRLTRSRDAAGELVAQLGVPLLDEYLEFLAGRCRPNTVLAVAYDLKVFFTVVAKPPRRVRPADVLGFMTAQRTGGDRRLHVAAPGAGVCRPGRRGGRCRVCRACMGSCTPISSPSSTATGPGTSRRIIRCCGRGRTAGRWTGTPSPG